MKRIKRLLLTTMSMVSLPLLMRAMPAHPQPFTYTQPDGQQYTLILIGDEHAHEYITTDSLLATIDSDGFVHVGQHVTSDILHRKLATTRAKSRKIIHRQQSERHFNHPPRGLLILVGFSDLTFSNDAETFDMMMNQEGYNNPYGIGSARDYFASQSMGQYIPVFDVVGPVTISQPYSYYGHNLDNENKDDQHPEEMIYDAVAEVLEQGLVEDLSIYDHDEDGIVDMVYVIYAGKGENNGGSADTIWPHMWDFRETEHIDATLQGLHFGLYACSAELERNNTVCGIGTFCHEFGHCLGLPDLYDVDYSGGFGLGSLDVMSGGGYNGRGWCPPAYSAFERYSLGWLELEELVTDGTYQLEKINISNKAFSITSKENPSEYFIFENRQKHEWDIYLPAHGMMITHVDYDETAWMENTVNDDPDHPRVTIMPADGRLNSSSTSGDLYPGSAGNTEFSDNSNPQAATWDGTTLQRPVTDITETDGIIKIGFKNNLTAVTRVGQNENTSAGTPYSILGLPLTLPREKTHLPVIISKGKKFVIR